MPYIPTPPPSAFSPMEPLDSFGVRFHFFTAASLARSGFSNHTLYTNPFTDHLIHPFIGVPATYNGALAAQVASEISNEMQARNLYIGRGEAGPSRQYSSSFFIQNNTGGNPAQYIKNNPSDLLSSWGNPSGTNQTSYTPYQATGRANTASFSALVASAIQTEVVNNGICVPYFCIDDDEGPANTGLTAYDTGTTFAEGGFRSGWFPIALVDPRYATAPVALIKSSTGSIELLTLQEYIRRFPPPVYDASIFWLDASQLPFQRWLYNLTLHIASTTHYLGPESGLRNTFPLMQFANYNFHGGSAPGISDFTSDATQYLDPGYDSFGGGNDYSLVRFPKPYILQEWSHTPNFGASYYNRNISDYPSPFHFWLAQTLAQYTLIGNLRGPSPSFIQLPTPGQTVAITSSGQADLSFTLTPEQCIFLCQTLYDAGCRRFIFFNSFQLPGPPGPSDAATIEAQWDGTEQVVNALVLYADAARLYRTFRLWPFFPSQTYPGTGNLRAR